MKYVAYSIIFLVGLAFSQCFFTVSTIPPNNSAVAYLYAAPALNSFTKYIDVLLNPHLLPPPVHHFPSSALFGCRPANANSGTVSGGEAASNAAAAAAATVKPKKTKKKKNANKGDKTKGEVARGAPRLEGEALRDELIRREKREEERVLAVNTLFYRSRAYNVSVGAAVQVLP